MLRGIFVEYIATGLLGSHSARFPSGTALDPRANASGSGKHAPPAGEAGSKSAGHLMASVWTSRYGLKNTLEKLEVPNSFCCGKLPRLYVDKTVYAEASSLFNFVSSIVAST